MAKYNIETYEGETWPLVVLLKRLEQYKENGLEEEQWAWGAAIEEVKELIRSN